MANTQAWIHSESKAPNAAHGAAFDVARQLGGSALENILSRSISPEEQIQRLYLRNQWKETKSKAAYKLRTHCFTLLDLVAVPDRADFQQHYIQYYPTSIQVKAIYAFGDVIKDHPDICVWLAFKKESRNRFKVKFVGLCSELEASASLVQGFSADMHGVRRLFQCHTHGLTLLRIGGILEMDENGFQLHRNNEHLSRDDINKWRESFEVVLSLLLSPETKEVSQWYLRFWVDQMENSMPVQLAVEAREPLKRFLDQIKENDLLSFKLDNSVKATLQSLCIKLHNFRFCHIALLFSKRENSRVSALCSAISDLNSIAHFYNYNLSPSERDASMELEMLPNPSFPMEAIAQLSEVLALRRANANCITGMNQDVKMETETLCLSLIFCTLLNDILSLFNKKISEDHKWARWLSNGSGILDTYFLESPLSRLGDVLLSLPQVYEQLTHGPETSPSHYSPSRVRAQLKFLRYNLHAFSLDNLPEAVSHTLRSFIRLLDCHENGMKIRTLEIGNLLNSSAFKTLVVDLGDRNLRTVSFFYLAQCPLSSTSSFPILDVSTALRFSAALQADIPNDRVKEGLTEAFQHMRNYITELITILDSGVLSTIDKSLLSDLLVLLSNSRDETQQDRHGSPSQLFHWGQGVADLFHMQSQYRRVPYGPRGHFNPDRRTFQGTLAPLLPSSGIPSMSPENPRVHPPARSAQRTVRHRQSERQRTHGGDQQPPTLDTVSPLLVLPQRIQGFLAQTRLATLNILAKAITYRFLMNLSFFLYCLIFLFFLHSELLKWSATGRNK